MVRCGGEGKGEGNEGVASKDQTRSTKHTQDPPQTRQTNPTTTAETSPVFLTAADILSQPADSFPSDEPPHGDVSWKTLFSAGHTPTDALTAGIATCPAGTGSLALHRHAQAEIYMILEGEGVVSVAGQERKVGKGDVVFIPGDAEHGIRCLTEREEDVSEEGEVGEGQGVVWLYCFAADKFGDVRYVWS